MRTQALPAALAAMRRTRAEFQDWARGLAATHGYAVSFEGIGHASGEAGALAGPALRGAPDLGAASQARPHVPTLKNFQNRGIFWFPCDTARHRWHCPTCSGCCALMQCTDAGPCPPARPDTLDPAHCRAWLARVVISCKAFMQQPCAQSAPACSRPPVVLRPPMLSPPHAHALHLFAHRSRDAQARADMRTCVQPASCMQAAVFVLQGPRDALP